MKTDMGEYLVGAYLKLVKKCDVVDYNVRPPGGRLLGLIELDVVGLDFENKKVFLCEVTTHIRGTLYKDYATTFVKVRDKNIRQRSYAMKHLPGFRKRVFMFWSPVVPCGIVSKLRKIKGLKLIVNEEYSRCVEELQACAKTMTHDINNPFFRTLQILGHLRR